MIAFSISNLANKKTIVSLLFFIVFAWILLAVTPDFHSYFDQSIRYPTYMFLAGIALFFIHNIVLIPIKFEENNNRKYLAFIITCILIFAFIVVVLFIDLIERMNDLGPNIFGIVPDQLLTLSTILKVTAGIFIPLLAIATLSIIYCLLVYGFPKISPYLEAFVHVFVLTMLFTLLITVQGKNSREISLIVPFLLVFYANTFWITPILLKGKKPKTYLLGLLTLVLGYFFIQTTLLSIFGFLRFNPETGHTITRGNLPEIIFSTPSIIVLIIALFLSFIYGYVRIKIKTKEKFLNIKLGEKESELKLLKSQVNPHFLFNTLNTLYATALSENADKTGASIAKLASLLRYMQKDIIKDFIPLENEIKYLQDYVAIQKLRCQVEPQVETRFENFETQLISPGLFIPFVENAFKYGIDPSKPSKLSVSVICDKNNIHFSCINSFDDEFKTFYKEQGFGIGIKNAKQRLELVYPKNHTFDLQKKNNEFSVLITITDQAINRKI